MRDILSEWQYGEGAIKTVGKLLVQEACMSGLDRIDGVEKGNLIAGVVIAPDGKTLLTKSKHKDTLKVIEQGVEMWEVDLIIVPKRKYRINKKESCWGALRIDQKLCSSWWNKESWEEKIFEAK